MKNKSIKQIKEYLAVHDSLDQQLFFEVQQDERKGVQQVFAQWQKKQKKKEHSVALFEKMNYFENQSRQKGFQYIAGIDEVGRGPLAGPVVAAAVILPENSQLLGVNDSKKLTAKKRVQLDKQIKTEAIAIGIGVIEPKVIDQKNIYQASKLAMEEAVGQLTVSPDFLLIDAMTLSLDYSQENIIKGDTKSISIAAASIVAKVFRDQLMETYDEKYPGYGFAQNAGYGTKTHLIALEKQGVCPIHRTSFAPIKNYL